MHHGWKMDSRRSGYVWYIINNGFEDKSNAFHHSFYHKVAEKASNSYKETRLGFSQVVDAWYGCSHIDSVFNNTIIDLF